MNKIFLEDGRSASYNSSSEKMQLIILYIFKKLNMKFCKKFLVPFVLIKVFFSVHSVAQTTDDLEQMIRIENAYEN